MAKQPMRGKEKTFSKVECLPYPIKREGDRFQLIPVNFKFAGYVDVPIIRQITVTKERTKGVRQAQPLE